MAQSLIFDGTKWDGTFWSAVKLPFEEDDNLVCHWRLDESFGTIAYDCGSYGRNGTLKGTAGTLPIWGKGKIGNCATFDGTSSVIPFAQSFTGTKIDFSVSGWFYCKDIAGTLTGNTASGIVTEMGGYSVGAQTGYQVRISQSGTMCQWSFNWCNGTDYGGLYATNMSKTNWLNAFGNRWIHFACVMRGSIAGTMGTALIYHNGTVVMGTNNTYPSMKSYTSGTSFIGRTNWNYSGFGWSGALDDIKIWSKALSSTEISQEYGYGTSGKFPQFTLNNQWGSRLVENTARVRGMSGSCILTANSVQSHIIFPTSYFSMIPVVDCYLQVAWFPTTDKKFLGNYTDRYKNWVMGSLAYDTINDTSQYAGYIPVPEGICFTQVTTGGFYIRLNSSVLLPEFGTFLIFWHAFGI